MKYLIVPIIFIMITTTIMAQETEKPKWLDTNLYPFESNYLNIGSDKMHYVDEGSGPVMLFVHGTPSWSFLYRDMIKHFSKTHRCIAPDHLGFGLSDKPENYDYSPEQLAENLTLFIEQLGLKDIILVVHDFGGPIGLSYAINHPENIARVVLFNTWMWETASDPDVKKIDKILHSSLGKFLYKRFNFSPKVLLKKGFADKKKLTKRIHRHYLKPFPSAKYRSSPLKIGYGLLGASDWYQSLWEQHQKITHKPFLVLWGMQDTFLAPKYLERWKSILKNATVQELEGGHFVQEEAKTTINQALSKFLKG